MTASDQRKARRSHLHTVDDPPRGGIVEKVTVSAHNPDQKEPPRIDIKVKPFTLPTIFVSHPKPKAERTTLDYATSASYWRGFAIGALTCLLIGLFIGVAVTHITQIMSIPITKETMEQGAMISKLFTETPR